MKALNVYYQGSTKPMLFGRLAVDGRKIQFEKDADFSLVERNLSPFNIKDIQTLQAGQPTPFKGLHGVFNDSLPDGWGMRLMNSEFAKSGMSEQEITPLTRLAYMGDRTMGALTYEPDIDKYAELEKGKQVDLIAMANNAIEVYRGETEEVINELRVNGGSPGGARPKVAIGLDIRNGMAISGADELPPNFEHWIVKFPTSKNPEDRYEGVIEYVFSAAARKCNIPFPETTLIRSENTLGYFAIKRFDRNHNQRIHMHSLSGLGYIDIRSDHVEYHSLIGVTKDITKNQKFSLQIFKQMVFNIIAGNRDDHAKNFSFLMSDDGVWSLSPAYDINFHEGINGHHSIYVNGEGLNITLKDVEAVGEKANLKKSEIKHIIDEIADVLSHWEDDAKSQGVPNTMTKNIQGYINKKIKTLSI
jgi:serine/threonine-protein kinase HipA